MIRFFRNIRHRLIEGNKTYKYILYATGEILLVVIGILIALEVNNRNESFKEDKIEKELLGELKEDLNETLKDLKSDIFTVNKTLEVTDSLYQDLYVEKRTNSSPYRVPF